MDADTFKRFHRTHISQDDFDDALRFIRRARDFFNESPEFEALLIAAVIAYARPFSRNEQGRNPPIDSRLDADLVPFQGSERELHERIINARNKAVAHAEAVYYPVEQAPPTIPGEASGTTFLTTTSQRWHIARDLNPNLDAFEAISKAMRQRCSVHLYTMAKLSYESSGTSGAG